MKKLQVKGSFFLKDKGRFFNTNIEIVRLLAKQGSLDLGNFNAILEWTIQDEKRHQAILTTIKELITGQGT